MSFITLTMNCIGDMLYVTNVGSVVQVIRGRRWSIRGRERWRGRKLKGGKGAREPQQEWIRSPLVGALAQGTGFEGSCRPRAEKMLVFDGGRHVWR